jgi:hypothetical protein
MNSLVEAGFGGSCARNKKADTNNGFLTEIVFVRTPFQHFQYYQVLRITGYGNVRNKL